VIEEFENGELPPVGSIVEKCFNSPTMEYRKVKILAHDEGVAVFRWLEGSKSGRLDESENFINHKGTSCECMAFRRVRTQKELAVDAAKSALKGFDLRPEVYEALYNADLLKLPRHKD